MASVSWPPTTCSHNTDANPSGDQRSDVVVPMSRLPNELLIRILKKVADFSSLNSLINTSSRLSNLFNNNAPDIIEAVLRAAVPIDIESAMRSVLQVRTQSFACQSWEEAPTFPLYHRQGFDPISPKISPPILRRFVGLAHKIHILTHLCLDRCLERCKSRLGLSEDSCWKPASYTEEHRALLGFWLVQYFFELKVARLKGRLHWTAKDLGDLQFATIDTFWLSTQPIPYQYTLTAHDFAAELRQDTRVTVFSPASRKTGWSSSTAQYWLPALPVSAGGTSGPFPDCQRHLPSLPVNAMGSRRKPVDMAIIDPNRRISTHQTPQPATLFREMFTNGLGHQPLAKSFTRDLSDLGELGPCDDAVGWGTFSFLRHQGHHLPPTFLEYVGFDPYRKLGLAIWDQYRMADLGLWMPGTLDRPTVYKAWIAILSREELSRAEAKHKLEEDDDEW